VAEIDTYSKRDQLSLNYALDKNKIKWRKITKWPQSVRNHPLFALAGHEASGLPEVLTNKLTKKTTDPYKQDSYSKVLNSRVRQYKREKIDIVICVHNAHEDIVMCLKSVKSARKANINQKLIIVDDASDEITAKYLRKFTQANSWATLVRNNKAVGYSKAANLGLKKSTGDLVILLNSDTIVTKNWAEKLADAIDSTPGSGIVGPVSNAAGHQSIPNIKGKDGQTAINKLPPGINPNEMNKYCEEWSPIDILPQVPLVHGFCIGIARSVIDAIGYFDVRNFPRGYGEENDYCLRAMDKGFGLVVATHTYVYHAKTKSYSPATRSNLVKMGSEKLHQLYSKERIVRSINSSDSNKLLERLREKARNLY